MQPHQSPEGEHSGHMARRRATAPYLFTPIGSYKNWLHFFSISRNMDGVGSVSNYTHMVLPWELEDTTLDANTIEMLDAHYNVHGMKEWHPLWRGSWLCTKIPPGFVQQHGVTHWKMLSEPKIGYLAHWMLGEKRRIRIENPYCDAAKILTPPLLEQGLRQFLIKQGV